MCRREHLSIYFIGRVFFLCLKGGIEMEIGIFLLRVLIFILEESISNEN